MSRGQPKLGKIPPFGFELSLDWQMTEALRTGFQYEYVRATIEAEDFAGSKIPLVPEVLLRLFLELNPIDSLRIKAGGSYVGESFRGSIFKQPTEDGRLLVVRLNCKL